MDTKKKKERNIFDFVYADRVLTSVAPSEEPDFKVKNADCEFGVEITEFYFSHSLARIRNIPGYAMEILEEGKYRHKDDFTPLAVKEFTVEPGDNRRPSFKVQGFMQERPKINDYVNKVSAVIEHKNTRFAIYVTGLNHVNLIIFDCEHCLLGTPKNKFHPLFFQPQLETALIHTSFREVYFVTQLGEFDSPKKVYIPLKMVFLVAEMFLFNHIMTEEYTDALLTYAEKLGLLCAEYLLWRGAKDISFKDGSDGYEVVYGNAGIFIAKDNSVTIRDYSDLALPVDFTLVSTQGVSSFFNDAFLKTFETYKHGTVFSSELCFDVGGDNQPTLQK
jgi:hypothetical protein